MLELNLYPITGLYQELYNPDLLSMSEPLGTESGIDVFKNINSYFWANVLSEKTIDFLLDVLNDRKEFIDNMNFKYKAILNNPHFFKKSVKDAVVALSSHSISKKGFFSYLETLQIFCNLYSEFVSAPFVLTIEDGFDVDEISSETLISNALNPAKNPYYSFLKNNCRNIIIESNPKIIWIRGKIRLSTITLALFAKNANPQVHICVVGHSSEYYSLSKIVDYLKMNRLLFSVIDSIILDDDINAMKNLYDCVVNQSDLHNVDNILFFDKKKDMIVQTKTNISKQHISDWTTTRRKCITSNNGISASQLTNVRLWPNSKCFWNKCTFCGINKKYDEMHYGDSFANIDEKIEHIKEMHNNGCNYFWFIDEAIPPTTISSFAQKLLDNHIDIFWQVRSRIDYKYNDVDFSLLYKAGLREIRLGLESANSRIQKLMNKFSVDIDNLYIENLVKNFNDNGISVHFPMIIGFPTESVEERRETYEFLEYLSRNYPLTTFNINVLGLDVSSELFKEYPKFNISEIRFPCSPKYFLGNIVGWDSFESPYDRNTLDLERNNVMRNILYPWMPTNCILPIFIFYRLSETSRNTLIWKCIENEKKPLEIESIVEISEGNSEITRNTESSVIYNLSSHHLIECDKISLSLIDYLKKSKSVRDAVNYMLTLFSDESYDWNYYIEQIQQLEELGFIDVKHP